MTKEEIVKQVKDIIVDKLGVEESAVTESASFTNDLGADSLDTVESVFSASKSPMRKPAVSLPSVTPSPKLQKRLVPNKSSQT